ncbi:MAG: hypothetical protein HC867_00715 [Bacteroidia bacterium]|nr:hypothetical protein [Bacteroidia bacterium]
MKKKDLLIVLFLATLFLNCITVFCQESNRISPDSVMHANSEKWKVKQNKGLFGLAKPEFGPYVTHEVAKLDSPVIKKKTKDSSWAGAEITSSGTDIDISKFLTIEKTKFYRLLLGQQSDTAETVFSISSVSVEKKQTFLGKLLSKKDEGKDAVLDYSRDISGIILTGIDETPWNFFLDDYRSGSRQTAGNFHPSASISNGYLKNKTDSLYITLFSRYEADITFVNSRGEHLAALKFKQNPVYMWIRNDIEASYQQAIAAVFAVIIAIKDL